jgi:isocitrate dehydrogenase
VAGSVGLAGSANIGAHGAMFEAIHGSAPDIAGQGIANPSGLILAGVQMLQHLGQADVAERIHNAWLKTIEDGVHTADIADASVTKVRAGTESFADAVIARLGEEPASLKAVRYEAGAGGIPVPSYERKAPAAKTLVGIDVFVDWRADVDTLATAMQAAQNGAFSLKLITNRGVKVWPQGLPETFCTDHWRCRFEAKAGKQLTKAMVAELLMRLAQGGVDFVKTEHLFTFDGKPGYSLGQGE